MIWKLLSAPLVVGALALASPAPLGATHSTTTKNLAETVIAKSGTGGPDRNPYDYDLLLKAAVATGLDAALSDPAANLTVFAPNDAAFIRTARSLGYSGWSEQGTWDFLATALAPLGGGDPIPVVRNVLLYHVAPGRLGPLEVITAGRIDTLLEGASFGVRFIQLIDNEPDLPNPYLNPFALNIKASNGVIHGITRVLIPVNL